MVRFFISFSIPLILNCDIYPAFISPGTAASRSPHILISHFSMSLSDIISLIVVEEHESRELNTLSAMPGLKQPYATEQQHTWASSYVVHARPQGGGQMLRCPWCSALKSCLLDMLKHAYGKLLRGLEFCLTPQAIAIKHQLWQLRSAV